MVWIYDKGEGFMQIYMDLYKGQRIYADLCKRQRIYADLSGFMHRATGFKQIYPKDTSLSGLI